MRIGTVLSPTLVSIAAVATCHRLRHPRGGEGARCHTHFPPKGPGSVEGLGKNFAPSLASGTSSYGVDIAVPSAAAGIAPKLLLDFDSGGGISHLGIGWQLGGVAEIRRRTENGLPKFDSTDAFKIAGFGAPSDLLEVSSNVFRRVPKQYESDSFVRVQRSADGKTWEARDKSGTTYRFGGEGFVEEKSGQFATWLLREQLDVDGHSIQLCAGLRAQFGERASRAIGGHSATLFALATSAFIRTRRRHPTGSTPRENARAFPNTP